MPHEKVTDSFAKLCTYLEVDLANIFAGPDTAVAVDRFIEAILARKVAAPKRRQEAGRSSRPASGILFQDGSGTTHARSGGTQATQAVRHRGASEPANIRQFDGGLSNCNALKL